MGQKALETSYINKLLRLKRSFAPVVSLHHDVAGCKSHSLAKQPDRHGEKTEDAHEQTEDSEWKGRSRFLNPGADEEGPSETDNSTECDDHEEAIGTPCTIALNKVVEADRGHLHQTEGDHSIAELESNPCLWCCCLGRETKAKSAGGCDEEGREHERKTCFRFTETVSLLFGLALDDVVGSEVGIDCTETGTNQTTDVDQAD